TRDNVVGYVHIKDLATQTWRDGSVRLSEILRAPYFVPDTKAAADLFREMQQQRLSLAVVVDEQGGLSGIVAIDDLIEEVVGEIFSEHAPQTGRPSRDASGAAVIPGTTSIRELNRDLDLELPEGDWNTIAGLCIAVAGRIPATGDKLELAE